MRKWRQWFYLACQKSHCMSRQRGHAALAVRLESLHSLSCLTLMANKCLGDCAHFQSEFALLHAQWFMCVWLILKSRDLKSYKWHMSIIKKRTVQKMKTMMPSQCTGNFLFVFLTSDVSFRYTYIFILVKHRAIYPIIPSFAFKFNNMIWKLLVARKGMSQYLF